jgi:hypothetical protein
MADSAAVAETVCKIKDLGLGDMILVKSFDGPREVCAATRVQKGTDKSKVDMSLRGPDGFADDGPAGSVVAGRVDFLTIANNQGQGLLTDFFSDRLVGGMFSIT